MILYRNPIEKQIDSSEVSMDEMEKRIQVCYNGRDQMGDKLLDFGNHTNAKVTLKGDVTHHDLIVRYPVIL